MLSSFSVDKPVEKAAKNLWMGMGKVGGKNFADSLFHAKMWIKSALCKTCGKFSQYFFAAKIPLLSYRFSTFSTDPTTTTKYIKGGGIYEI